MNGGPSADVIICTYTTARWSLLVRSVNSIVNQRARPRRLIIVVDHNDELLERCRTRWGRGSSSPVPITVCANCFAGRLGSARNTGLLLADADVVVFLDDDAEAAEDCLERLLAVYESHPEAVAVGGAPRPVYDVPRPGWFPPEFDWIFGCHYGMLPSVLAPVRHLIGAIMSVRREDLLAVGGFHADDHDDMDLSHRIAHARGASAVLYEPLAEIRHHVSADRLTWAYFRRRCFYINRSKVAAVANMGSAGNLGAEIRFVGALLCRMGPAMLALSTGRTQPMQQWLVAMSGTAIAGLGYLVGRIQLAFGAKSTCLTVGLNKDYVDQAGVAALSRDA